MRRIPAAASFLAAIAAIAPIALSADADARDGRPPAAAANAAAAAATAAATTDSASAEVLRLEDAWAQALVRHDTATFERTLADGFIYTENEKSYTRAEVLHDLATTADTVRAARNEEMSVHPFGDARVVTGWLIVSGRGASGAFERRYRFTDVWMRSPDAWRIVAAQDYLVP